MSFIVENVSKEDKEKIPFPIKDSIRLRWGIDRDQDAFIVLTGSVGGPYDGTQKTNYYTLSWKGELISISADPLPITFTEKGATMHWRIHQLNIPVSLKDHKSEIFHLVQDAFFAVGEFFNGSRFIATAVEFDLPIKADELECASALKMGE